MDTEPKAPWVELLCDKECIICLDSKENDWLQLECNHEYHKKCIHQWMRIRMTCPICVQSIPHHHIIQPIEHEPNIENIPDIEDRSNEICQRNVSEVFCMMLLFSIVSITVGAIISSYH